MRRHRQVTVDNDIQVTRTVDRPYLHRHDRHIEDVNFLDLPFRPQPDKLSICRVQT